MERKKRVIEGVDSWPITKHDIDGTTGAKWWYCRCPKCNIVHRRFLYWKGNAERPPIYCTPCKRWMDLPAKLRCNEKEYDQDRDDVDFYPVHSKEAQKILDEEVLKEWQIDQYKE